MVQRYYLRSLFQLSFFWIVLEKSFLGEYRFFKKQCQGCCFYSKFQFINDFWIIKLSNYIEKFTWWVMFFWGIMKNYFSVYLSLFFWWFPEKLGLLAYGKPCCSWLQALMRCPSSSNILDRDQWSSRVPVAVT